MRVLRFAAVVAVLGGLCGSASAQPAESEVPALATENPYVDGAAPPPEPDVGVPPDDAVPAPPDPSGPPDPPDPSDVPDAVPAPVPPPAPAPPAESRDARDADILPFRWDIGGYFRTRFVWAGNVPGRRRISDVRNPALDARYAFMRARLEPSFSYGPDAEAPIAVLRLQLDGLDNVVFGDNARVTRTPIFAADPSVTDIEGFDLSDSIRLERAWIEFLVPVGQLRVGRMPSQWGFGLLTSDGNGVGEWGDPNFGSTFDRILFATRPLTVVNALTRGDARPTPLILAFAYDKLVEDPVRAGTDPPAGTATEAPDDVSLGPLSSTYEERPGAPFAFLSRGGDDVSSVTTALVWRDLDFGRYEPDELSAGFYFVYRWQGSTSSDVFIMDAFTKYRHRFSPRMPQFHFDFELLNIRGQTRGVTLAGGCVEETGICNEGEADIWGLMARTGFEDEGRWGAWLEVGHASGDGQLFDDDRLTVRPMHPDYHVGMVMYQMALAAQTANGLGEDIRPLWSRGGVWNSTYIWPQARYTVFPGIEVHGALLLAWADELLPTVYVNERDDFTDTSCHFDGDCFVGVETDLALRVKWGDDDLMQWDTEVGLMVAGDALRGPTFGLSERFLWTVQTRIAMVF